MIGLAWSIWTFTECLGELENAGDYYRASGFWAPFFHDVMDLFGMESYLTKDVYTSGDRAGSN